MLISGEIYYKEEGHFRLNSLKSYENKKEIIKKNIPKKEIIIFKSKEFNEIYEKSIDDKNNCKISELKEFNYNLKRGHILLVDTKKNFLLGKKRNPSKLFQDKIIK